MSGPHKFKLVYFESQGRAEITRLMFAHAGVEFEDYRVSQKDWPSYKAGTPFGQLPVLEVDGKHKIAQSKSIARYVAIETGIAGRTHIERAMANMYVELIHDDMFKKLGPILAIQDAEKKAEEMKTFEDGFWPELCQKLEDRLKINGAFLVGKELTWADIAVADGLDSVRKMSPLKLSFETYPLLKELVESVFANPGIVAWLEKRPVYNM